MKKVIKSGEHGYVERFECTACGCEFKSNEEMETYARCPECGKCFKRK